MVDPRKIDIFFARNTLAPRGERKAKACHKNYLLI
jgi:hypothetical protein